MQRHVNLVTNNKWVAQCKRDERRIFSLLELCLIRIKPPKYFVNLGKGSKHIGIEEKISKLPRHWAFWGESTGDRRITLTKDQ